MRVGVCLSVFSDNHSKSHEWILIQIFLGNVEWAKKKLNKLW